MNKELQEFFNQYSDEVQNIFTEIYQLVASIMLPCNKEWLEQGHKMVIYGKDKSMKSEICYIKPLKDSVNLGFFYGTKLSDPKRLLQGTGKTLRHVKIRRESDIDYDGIKQLLIEALAEHNTRLGF